MEWSYNKDFKVLPGVKIVYGKNGITTELKEQYKSDTHPKIDAEKLKYQINKYVEPGAVELKSAPIQKLTSNSLKEFWSLILLSDENFSDVRSKHDGSQAELELLERKIERTENSLFRFLFKKRLARYKSEQVEETSRFDEYRQQLALSKICIEIDADDDFNKQYELVKNSFYLLISSHKKWDFTTSRNVDRFAERSAAGTSITRSEISMSERPLPILQSDDLPLCMHNINGGDIYFYPGFLIVYEDVRKFAVIDYGEITIHGHSIKFHERESVPSDSKTVGRTWHKVNKDGSPDRRFVNNFQIPIVEYFEISFSSKSGLHEVYCFSNVEYGQLFYKAFHDYIDSIKQANKLLSSFK